MMFNLMDSTVLVPANPWKLAATRSVDWVRSESLGHFIELLASVLSVFFPPGLCRISVQYWVIYLLVYNTLCICGGGGREWGEKGILFQMETVIFQPLENSHPLPWLNPKYWAKVWSPEPNCLQPRPAAYQGLPGANVSTCLCLGFPLCKRDKQLRSQMDFIF